MRPRPRRSLLSALLVVGLLGVAAGPAQADLIEHNGDDIQYFDDSGESSTLTVTASRTQIVVTQDGGDTIDESADECSGDGTTTVTCTPAAGTEFDVFETAFFMDDGNDTVTLGGELGVAVLGDGGNDIVAGSDTNGSGELLDGGAGDDQLNARNVGTALPVEPDLVRGSDGIFDPTIVGDDVHGGDGSDQVASGNGFDFVTGDGEVFFLAGVRSRDQMGSGADGIPSGENPGTDVISTGAGNDFAFAGEGNNDQLNLGEGEDFTFTFGGDGTGDAYAGGPGIDEIAFESSSEENNLAGGGSGLPFDDFGVNLATGAVTKTNTASPSTNESDTAVEFEDAFTDAGNDSVTGTDASQIITTGPGSDNVNPGNGADTLFLDPGSGGGLSIASKGADGINGVQAVPGNDVADVADGFNDRVFCGGGTDNVTADQFDEIATDCDVVTRVEKRAGNADVIAPDCTLGSVKSRYSRKAFLRGFNVRIACSEGASLTVQLLAKWTRKLFPSRAGDVVLAQKTTTVTAGTAGTVKVRPAKKFRKRFRKKGFRVRVNVEAQDQYGNRSVERKTVKVKKVRRKKRR